MHGRRWWPLTALLLGAFFLYAIGLDYSPSALHGAEVMFALHAHYIATTAHDLYGRFMPLYFQMQPLGENTWWHPVIVYWMAAFFQVIPPSAWGVRLPTVFVGLTNIALIYFIGKRLFGDTRWALVAAALLALTPAHFIQSRIAMDYIYPVPFMLAWLLCLLVYRDRKRPWLIFLGTSLLGIGFYSYLAAVLMMPMYLGVTWLVLWKTSDRPARLCALAAAGFVWPLLLLPFWLAWHPSMVRETILRYPTPVKGGLRVTDVTGRLSLYWSYFDPAFLFISGGYSSVMNSTRFVGVFLLPLLVFLPAGIWRIATAERSLPHWLVVCGFITAPITACIVPEPYAIDREMVLVPFGVLLATYGAAHLWRSPLPRVRQATIALLVLTLMHFAFFCFIYFGEYRIRSAFWFEGNHRGALEEVLAREAARETPKIYLSQPRDPMIEPYWHLALIQHGRTDLLQRTIYFDADTLPIESVPMGSAVLFTGDDARLHAMVAAGQLRELVAIPELDRPSWLFVATR